MFYYLYEVKNNLNGKIYVGVHKTNDLNDGYMGSGKYIRSVITKHGISSFTKVILETFENAEAMYAREKEIVTDEFLLRDDVYNLRRGGFGGFDQINKKLTSSDFSRRGKVGRKKQLMFADAPTWGNNPNFNEMHNKGIITRKNRGDNFTKEACKSAASIASIEKRKKTYKETCHQHGEKNSQYGSMWITNGLENKKIKKTDSLPRGFRKGRSSKKQN